MAGSDQKGGRGFGGAGGGFGAHPPVGAAEVAKTWCHGPSAEAAASTAKASGASSGTKMEYSKPVGEMGLPVSIVRFHGPLELTAEFQ